MLSASTRHILAKHDLYANQGARCCSVPGDDSDAPSVPWSASRFTRAMASQGTLAAKPKHEQLFQSRIMSAALSGESCPQSHMVQAGTERRGLAAITRPGITGSA